MQPTRVAALVRKLGIPVSRTLSIEASLRQQRDALLERCERHEHERISQLAEIGRYRTWFEKSKQRERALAVTCERQEAEIARLKRDLYCRKSEARKKTEAGKKKKSSIPRGQQPGNPVPPRRQYENLAAVAEVVDLPADQRQCPCCGKELHRLPLDDESNVIEIFVKGYRRKITKRTYAPSCDCGHLPGVVSQPAVGAVFPGSNFGVSVIREFILAKFAFGEPIHRLIERWHGLGLDVADGTMYGLQRPIQRLFAPLYQRIGERNRQADHWHIDETRWQVLVEVEGKEGTRWWMWVFLTEDTVYYILSPHRSAQVVIDHMGNNPVGIANVDRYSAYKAVAVRTLHFLLAFCWAHARRDFATLAATIPACQRYAMAMVAQIGELNHVNKLRVAHLEHPNSDAFKAADRVVRRQAEQIRQQVITDLPNRHLRPEIHKVLESMNEHMEGLMLFVDHPEIPMDNNAAERALRSQVVIRKNSFFSASVGTAQCHVEVTSVLATLQRCGINIDAWATDYLEQCALHGGKPPPDYERFLPWNASAADRENWTKPRSAHPWPLDERTVVDSA